MGATEKRRGKKAQQRMDAAKKQPLPPLKRLPARSFKHRFQVVQNAHKTRHGVVAGYQCLGCGVKVIQTQSGWVREGGDGAGVCR